MKELDLHGLSHNEAVDISEDFVLMESHNSMFQCKIITGNSISLQDKIINQVLIKHNFKYYIPSWNTGEIIVS